MIRDFPRGRDNEKVATKVGVIANPESGRDIRRLVAHASVFRNMEKVNIVQRIILGLESMGCDEVLIMPDSFGIGIRAITSLYDHNLTIKVSILDMPVEGTHQDSIRAARIMSKAKVGCIVTLGGDGTNRVVAKGCGNTPLVPISTGTNNVIPQMIEGTIAGLAAGIVALNVIRLGDISVQSKKLSVIKNGEVVDLALIDATISDDVFKGSRALWNISKIRQIVATCGEPTRTGMTSIVGCFHPIKVKAKHGIYIEIGRNKNREGKLRLKAPIAPGLVEELVITDFRVLNIGDKIEVNHKPSTVALDGEREIEVYRSDHVDIELCDEGPIFVNVEKAMLQATHNGFWITSQK